MRRRVKLYIIYFQSKHFKCAQAESVYRYRTYSQFINQKIDLNDVGRQ